MRLEVERHSVPLAQPLTASYGVIEERTLLTVSVADRDGARGFGEGAPLEPYDGVSPARAEQALARYRDVLAAHLDADHAQLIEACRRADDLPPALAALDLALWDLAGRRAGQPVAALLCERPLAVVQVNATLVASEPAGLAEQAAAAARAGFRCVKMKVGLADDRARVTAVRAAAGPALALRLDANGAWDVEQAVRTIGALAAVGIELVEEPVHGVRETAAVRARVAARIAIDETAASPEALDAGAADAVCLKVSRCGGISGLLAAAARVRASGSEPYVGSTLDGPLGIAAGLHAAAALGAQGPMPACGLATLPLLAGVEDALPAHEGAIAVPSAPGLGVAPF